MSFTLEQCDEDSYRISFKESLIFKDVSIEGLEIPNDKNRSPSDLCELSIYDEDSKVLIEIKVPIYKLIDNIQKAIRNEYNLEGYKRALENIEIVGECFNN